MYKSVRTAKKKKPSERATRLFDQDMKIMLDNLKSFMTGVISAGNEQDKWNERLDKWNELSAWEDKNNTVSFMNVSSDDVREYYEDERFTHFSDEEILENLRYVARKIHLTDEYHFIVDEVCEMMEVETGITDD